MGLFCKIFGHKPEVYRRLVPSGYDGIGRHHGLLKARCRRCEETYLEGNVHIPNDAIIESAKRAQKAKQGEQA